MSLDENDLKIIKTMAETAVYEKVKAEALEGAGGSDMADEQQQKRQGKPSVDEPWYETLMFTNAKRTFDEFQDVSLASARRSQSHLDSLNNITLQAMQNAVETANMVSKNALETANMTGKQAVKHADVSADAMWNPIQQGSADALTIRAVSLDDASLKAIGTVVATALANALVQSKSA